MDERVRLVCIDPGIRSFLTKGRRYWGEFLLIDGQPFYVVKGKNYYTWRFKEISFGSPLDLNKYE